MKDTEIYKRLTSESPKIFKLIIRISLAVGAIGAAIIALPSTTGIVLSPVLLNISTHMIIAGAVGATIGKMTVEDKNDIK